MKNMKQARLLGFTLLVSGMATPALAQPHKPTIIEFDAPGAGTGPYQGTFPQDINDAGAIIGFTDGGNGFVRNPDGTFTSFVVAGAEITVPESINSKGRSQDTPVITLFVLASNAPQVGKSRRSTLRGPDRRGPRDLCVEHQPGRRNCGNLC